MEKDIIDGINNDKGFIGEQGFKVIELNDKEAKMEYKVKKSGLNPMKIVHGGVLFSLADTVAGTLARMTGKFPLTINGNINYLRPASGEKVIAVATKLKEGKTIGYYNVDIFDENKKLLANAAINMFYVEANETKENLNNE